MGKLFCLFLIFLFEQQKSYAGGYMGGDTDMHDRPLHWAVVIWIAIWCWLSSKFQNKNKKLADFCAYVCIGIPAILLIILFLQAVIIQIVK